MAAVIRNEIDDRKRSKESETSSFLRESENVSSLNYAPKPFVSKSLQLMPWNMVQAVEYLIFYKPIHLKPGVVALGSSRGLLSKISFLRNSSSRIAFDFTEQSKRLQSGPSPNVVGSNIGLEERLDQIIKGGDKRKYIYSGNMRASPLFSMRTDPWPKQIPKTKTFTVTISETQTLKLYFVRGRAAVEGTDQAAVINEDNDAYCSRVKTYKKTYNVEAQTPIYMKTQRGVGTVSKNTRTEAQIQACYSDIYDCSMKFVDNAESKRTSINNATSLVELGESTSVTGIAHDLNDEADELDEALKIVDIVESKDFLLSYTMLSRTMNKTFNWRKQMMFVGGGKTNSLAKECPITYEINHLWTLRYLKIWGMPVTSVSINPCNTSILAVGHGMYFMDQPPYLGRVCIWSLKNCSRPEKRMDFRAGVTCVSFSKKHPFALLVSLLSGEINLVDISKPTLEILASCGDDTNKTIWHVRWFTFDSGLEEPIACGEDGQIYIVRIDNFKKNAFLTLNRREGIVKGIMLPKSCTKPLLISLRPSVTCIAANPEDYVNYLVGTDDGCVHLCSTDFWHEHVDVFQAHIGPVRHIKYHPDCSKLFLTVGVDCCVRVWINGVFQPIVYLYENDYPIEDADWSPVNPNIIVTVSSNQLSIWDISRVKLVTQSSIKSPTGSRFTCVNFTSDGSNLVCGDLTGDVHVYTLSNMPFRFLNKLGVLRRTFKRLLLGKKVLSDLIQTVGCPLEGTDAKDPEL